MLLTRPRHTFFAARQLLARIALASAVGASTALTVLAQPAATPFLRVRVDEARNRAMLDIPVGQLDKDFLHQVTLATGFPAGGLDRAQAGQSVVVRLEKRGNRILMVRDNWSVRAPAGDAANQRAAAEAFPRSVVASFTVDSARDGVYTVDASSLFLADVYGVTESLRGSQAGAYRVDVSRSWLDTARTKSFARNAEVHAVLTFVSDAPGGAVRRAAPDAKAMTFEEHHSLVV